jgi:anaerobic selenocysteine-containing dehydrogenase
MCPMNCHPTLCGMQVTVQNGRVTRIEGDEDNPDSRGFLCMRGRAAGEIFGNERRILYPMARTGRDAGAWERISWSEALSRIAGSVARHPPEQFGIWMGHGDAATNYGTRSGGQLAKRFAHLYGSQWWHPAMICWGLGGFGLGLTGVLEVNTKEDMSAHSDLIVLWGANIASQPNTARHLKLAKARGARVITIDVRDSEASARADLHLRIRPGSDAALALGMMHTLINEDLIDRAFVDAHTLGYEPLVAHVRGHDAAWAARHTGLDAEVIIDVARQYAATHRAMIVMGGSSMHKGVNGWHGARAIACLPALTGKLGVEGGGLGERHGGTAHGFGLNDLSPTGASACTAVIPDQMSAMLDAFEAGKLKTLLLNGTNMGSSFAETHRLERGLHNVEQIVCIDLFMNETISQHADIVLPATAWLEQLGAKMTHTHLYLMAAALVPEGECRSFSQILRGLAEALDIQQFFPWDDDEQMLEQLFDHRATGHVSIRELREQGGKRALDVTRHAYPTHTFSTPSGKVEFFSDQAVQMGLPALPVFTPRVDSAQHPLQFRQGRTLTHFHAFYDHGAALPTMRKRRGKPTLWIAPGDAEPRHIDDGDSVRIFNERGEFCATAFVTPKIETGTVWMRDGWAGLNRVTDGNACLPEGALATFAFGVGQSLHDAQVDVTRLVERTS